MQREIMPLVMYGIRITLFASVSGMISYRFYINFMMSSVTVKNIDFCIKMNIEALGGNIGKIKEEPTDS